MWIEGSYEESISGVEDGIQWDCEVAEEYYEEN